MARIMLATNVKDVGSMAKAKGSSAKHVTITGLFVCRDSRANAFMISAQSDTLTSVLSLTTEAATEVVKGLLLELLTVPTNVDALAQDDELRKILDSARGILKAAYTKPV